MKLFPIIRFVFFVALFFLAFLVPWWVVLLASFFYVFVFDSYFEIFIIGVIIDIIYGPQQNMFLAFKFFLIFACFSAGVYFLKKQTVFSV